MKEKEYNDYVSYLNNIKHNGIDDDLLMTFINDTIMKALENYNGNKTNASIKTYMYKILINKINYYWIRKKDIYFEEINFSNNEDIDDFDFEEEYENDLKLNRILNIINELPELNKNIFISYFIDDLSLKEIYEKYNFTNMNSLKTRIFNLKNKIRKQYDKLYK